ncbi:MAG: MmcB family DNA repair protein [Fusobacterium sp.]|uniref:MmcB family DNA repair protein n=1 Tax=uncultured Fusobacterium sp. TaxID=159267 RepID=UPI0015A524F4|nr:MmcB family DNA repair protein [uncultured Fusobacterium sp.]
MEEIKNNSLLENIEKQITDLISLDKKNWTNFYTLLKKVEIERLWEEKYNSFTQWLKDFSIRNKIHESILWQRKKAGEVYQKYSEIQKEKGIEVKPLETANVSAENLVLLDKIMRNSPSNSTELAEKVFNNTITGKELRQIHNSVRPNRYDDLDDSDEEENENEKVSEDSSPVINTTDILGMLFNTDSWIGAKQEKNYFKTSFISKAQLLTEFPVYTGTSRNSRRIDLFCAENITTEYPWNLNLHGVEIKISKADLLNDCKYTEYGEFVDYLWLAVPQDLQEIAEQNKFTGCGLIVIDRDKKTDKLILKVIETPKKLTPLRKEETLTSLALKLMMK